MAGSIGGNDEEPIAAINVVPLVDIILVVLIIFMVTAPLVLKPSIDVNLPKASSGEDSPPTPLSISLDSQGRLALNGKTTSLTEIAQIAASMAKDKPDTMAVLEADRTVTLEKLTELIDVVKSSGIHRVAFSTQKK